MNAGIYVYTTNRVLSLSTYTFISNLEGNIGYYVNPAYSTVEAASVRSSEKTSPGVEGAPTYVFHRNAPG